jgi:hypothetical protein
MTRPQSFQVGSFVIRRDATAPGWRVFCDGVQVFVTDDQRQATRWARTASSSDVETCDICGDPNCAHPGRLAF